MGRCEPSLRWVWVAVVLGTIAAAGCSNLPLDPPRDVIHARFDPDEGAIPMPSNVVRDDELGRLDIPLDDEDLTATEREFFEFLNTTDGWSTTSAPRVEFTGGIRPDSVTPQSLQVWQWGPSPRRVGDVHWTLSDDEKTLEIEPPREGWDRGATYVVLVRGGEAGVEGEAGQRVVADAAFYFLRLTERLDDGTHDRAFPGDDAAERADNAADLEELRVELAPYFDHFERAGLERSEIAALWAFTVTERVELAMDKVSQRMPLPSNMLLNPRTGFVDIPPAEWDSDVETEAKERINTFTGFGVSANLLFEFTGEVDPATINNDTIKLYDLNGPPLELAAEVELMADGIHVIVKPQSAPLPEQSTFAVVVERGVRDTSGADVLPMALGHLLTSTTPVVENGISTIDALELEDAERAEGPRRQLAGLLDSLGRENVLTAWPFTTMPIREPLASDINTAATLGIDPNPTIEQEMTPGEALLDFAIAIASLISVDRVYHGTIKSPVFLDEVTRGWRADGGYEVEDVSFTMTIPDDVEPGDKVPVVIFGHAVMTERRFVLAIGSALARRGFAAVSIDWPLHGKRTHCLFGGPLSLIDPTTGELTSLPPCRRGFECRDNGQCVDDNGSSDNGLARWPVISMPVASGAAFLEVDKISNTADHFRQALVDVGALSRSLRQGDWKSKVGVEFATDKLYYAGQSLGGVIGGTFVSLAPEIERAVLNVPGADTVDMFLDSPFFGPQVDAFFTREDVEKGSFEAERFLDVARWIVDSVDPQSVASTLNRGREVMLQMATLDFIIPNDYTETLQNISGAPREDYLGEHGFLAIPIEPAYLPGVRDLARFIAGEDR